MKKEYTDYSNTITKEAYAKLPETEQLKYEPKEDSNGELVFALPVTKKMAVDDVNALMEYKGLTLEEAMNEVVHHKLIEIKGEGGMIGVDKEGNVAMVFNSAGMYRGMKTSKGEHKIGLYKEYHQLP
jgi:hypothetical protein